MKAFRLGQVLRTMMLTVLRAVLLATTMIALPCLAAPNWNDPAVIRDQLFAWCVDEGYAETPRSEETMRARSPDCAERVLEGKRAYGVDPLKNMHRLGNACALSQGSRPLPFRPDPRYPGSTRAGFCLTFPEENRLSPMNIVELVRANTIDSDGGERIRLQLASQLVGMAPMDTQRLLTTWGFECRADPGSVCSLNFGIIGWRAFESGLIGAVDLCSIGFSVTIRDVPIAAHDVRPSQVCI